MAHLVKETSFPFTKPSRKERLALICCAAGVLAGCSSTPALRIKRVNVPVPVVCQEPAPERPEMPTEILPVDVSLDGFAAAAIAELERREGYELRLRAALDACTAPLGERP